MTKGFMPHGNDGRIEPLAPLLRWQLEQIEQAIAEADAGDFSSDEEVRAMFDKLTGRESARR